MIGTVLANRYTIEEQIGVGGMSVVYRAKDTLLDRDVAIKILKDIYAHDEDFVRNFTVEAQAAGKLNHPNITLIYDVGIDKIGDKDIHYIVMEYVEGETLKNLIREYAPFKMETVRNFGIMIARALAVAHESGIIHRDIKPQNILVTKNNEVKVADFGIARVATSSTIAHTSTILGTVHYISPEQAKGKFIDKRADVYALGVVLYEMATGRVPYDGENSVAIAIKHIQEKLVPASVRNPNVPAGMDYIISKCLEKHPEHRYQSAEEVIRDLENYESLGFDQTAKITMTPPEPQAERNIYRSRQSRASKNTVKRAPRPKKSVFKTVVLPIILVLLLIAGIAYGYMKLKASMNAGELVVPSIVGKTEEEAKSILSDAGLVGELGGVIEDDSAESGKVVRQDPEPGVSVKEKSTVTYYLSSNEELVTVPGLVGSNVKEFDSKLSLVGLGKGTVGYESDKDVKKDLIISQFPEEGAKVKKGTRINVVVSLGKKEDKIKMLDLKDMDIDEARATLIGLGLKVTLPNKEEYSDTVKKGHVISQSIPKDQEVQKNTEITLTVSKGKKPKERNPQDRIPMSIPLTPDPNRTDYPITVIEVDGDVETPVYTQTYHSGDPTEVVIQVYPDCLYNVYHGDILVGQYQAGV